MAPQRERRQGRLMLLFSLLTVLVSSFVVPAPVTALPSLALPNEGTYNKAETQLYYNNLIFSGPHHVQEGDSLNTLPDEKPGSDGERFVYKPGTKFYRYIKPSDQDETEAFIVVVNKEKQPTQGQYSKFSYNTKTKAYSKRADTKNIELGEGEMPNIRNCNIPWVGWIVCPIGNALATALDDLYGVVSDILRVQPIDGEKTFQNGDPKPIYAIWEIIRNVSNIVFVILFFVVIISYLTGFGLSEYQIKKIFPRLFVTAILVNLSLTICTLLVDVFNILGYSTAQLFQNIQRSTMSDSDMMSISTVNWAGLLAAAYGAGGLAIALNGGILGATLLVLGGMAGALFMIVAVVVALSARQALVIILTIVSPLAFVLNLLPNTEKYFSKWLKTFVKILAIFPLFALIYGGAQLASSIIIQTANDSFILILVGLLVKVVPFGLLITIIKSSDTLMDKITSAATNRTKSLGEAAQDYFHRKQEIQKARYETGESKTFAGRYFTPRGLARTFNRSRRRDEARLRQAKATQDSLYNQKASMLDQNQQPANKDAQLEMAARVAEDAQSISRQRIDVNFDTMRAKIEADITARKGQIDHLTHDLEIDIAKNSLTKQIAEQEAKAMSFMQQDAQNRRIIENITLPEGLGYEVGTEIHEAMAGINADYRPSLLSQAIALERSETETAVSNFEALLNSLNLSINEKMALAVHDGFGDVYEKQIEAGINGIKKADKNGQEHMLDFDNEYLRTAAARIVSRIPRGDLHMALQHATIDGGVLAKDRELIQSSIHTSGVGKNMMMGIKTDDYILRGIFRGDDTYYEGELENIAKGRYSMDKIVAQDKDAMEVMVAGLEQMFDRTGKAGSIRLAEVDEITGKVIKRDMFDHMVALSKGKGRALENLTNFQNNLKNSLSDDFTRRQLQPVQIDNINKMIDQLSRIIPEMEKWSSAKNDILED